MTGQTPVKLWDPALAPRSLPNGMPLAERSKTADWTLLDTHVIDGLSSGADRVLWPAEPSDAARRFCEVYPEDSPTFISTPGAISADLLAALAQFGTPSRNLSLRWITKLGAPTPGGQAAGLSAATIRASVDRLRRDLGLGARAVATLIGLSTRRYYEFRAGDEPPAERLAQIRDRVDFINRLSTRDLPAAAELCRRRGTEVADLLTDGRLTEIEELFRSTARQRATMLETQRRPAFSGGEARDLLGVIEGAAFGTILELIRYLAPTVDARTSERIGAALRLEKNLKAVEAGDPVEDDWEFLLVMPPEEINSLRERADQVIRSEAFDQEAWTAFIASESEQAWAAFTYRPAETAEAELPEEATRERDVTSGWQADLGAFGVDLSLFDRRTR